MAAKQKKQSAKTKQPKGIKKAGSGTAPNAAAPTPPALPHQPGVTPGAVDVTGVVPEDVHVDPNITEGHPGYEESGGSEIHPSR